VFASSTNVDCNGNANGSATVVPTGGTPASGTEPYIYEWSDTQTDSIAVGLSGGVYSITVTDDVGCIATGSITITEPDVLAATITATDVACYGEFSGYADLVVTGGTPSYSYTWSNTGTTQDIAGLQSGTYDVTVTDLNNCTTSASVTINEPAMALQAMAIPTPITCYGNIDGEIDLTVGGGTSPYTYAWNYGQTDEDLTGLVGGNYSATVTDANGCTVSANTTVSSASPINVYATSTEVSCYGYADGTIDANISGGNLPYSVNWSNGSTDEDQTGLIA